MNRKWVFFGIGIVLFAALAALIVWLNRQWIIENKAWEWVFSGIGIALFALFKSLKPNTNAPETTAAIKEASAEEKLRQQYLKKLATESDILPLASLDANYADPQCGESLRLSDVYTPLDTTEIERAETEADVRKYLIHEQREARRISAQEMLDRHERLVLLGDPGSGKSTLVNYLTYTMAQGSLNQPKEWTEHLKQTGQWQRGILFPVKVILREFAANLDKDALPDSALLLSYMEKSLDSAMKDFWRFLYKALIEQEKACLILLDGLDEVSVELRRLVVQIIDRFADKYSKHRYVVTCRIYAYIGKEYQLGRFHQATLTPFSEEQIESFVSAWYQKLAVRGRFSEKEAKARAESLKSAAIRHDLIGLAERPLLMTVMALLHTFRGQLPDDRVDLYRQTVDLLLRQWEARLRGEKGIIEILNIPGLRMDRLETGLYHVAFKAHSACCTGETADIREGELREYLVPYLKDDWGKADEFVKYVRERAGLLIRHKPEAYTFPHRTFQEFMAACHLVVGTPDYTGEAARLLREDPDKWRIVFILAAGYAARTQRVMQAISSLNAVCPVSVHESEPTAADYRLAGIAAEALMEIGFLYVEEDKAGKAVLRRLRDWLVSAIQADDLLKARERSDLGKILAKLRDPRFNPDMFYLPNDKDEELGFVRIPAGEFQMGSDKERDEDAFDSEFPQHTVRLSEYWIARYPATVAQFRAFMKDTEYQTDEDWERFNEYDNHPVVIVSWDDAVAYCEWLTDKLKDRGWQIRLPTEAEWEYAARGADGRIYPWGDEADPDKANYHDTGINTTSAVGCFPGGASPHGILDMSGNVWEWCHDWYAEYPSDAVNDPTGPESGSNRVSRGGSFVNTARNCRSAFRDSWLPGLRVYNLGFRLVREAP